ncbi:ABC transporter ATP-binding protein [Chordicoccus furentiruminis]|uniref:ABC transporter ATP-binding protein n=1 Tax=Chordicoccus furentiruminis TaxID=2709410 RepID=UPI0023A7E8A1|nr:ABC transporter ATP-binding protein [Chordicoccus furentiruminis]
MAEKILEMKNVSKTFPGIKANQGVNLSLYRGEIHALLGENGAGKSTLMNILTGIYQPDEGQIFFNGKQVDVTSPKKAAELGIGMVHQHFRLIPVLTVAENIILTSGRCPAVLDERYINSEIRDCGEKYGLELDPEAKVWQLSVGEQQRVEIVKLLYHGADVLILDEPSAVLTPQESVRLFRTLRKMADSGKSIVFISHKMHEVMEYADRVTVLRRGKSVATVKRGEASVDDLTYLMMGHALSNMSEKEELPCGETILECDGVCAKNDRGIQGLKHISFTLRSGEILGVAGVAGNGQNLLAEVLAGMREAPRGKILYKGINITRYSIKKRKENGIAFAPEDRLGTGLVPQMDLMANLILKDYDKLQFSRHGIFRKKAIRSITEKCAEKYDIRSAGVNRPVGLMSGGNQQKLLLAREVSRDADVLIVAYPSRGLDIGAVSAVHHILDEERKKGTAILMISEDLDEIFEMSDRICVLFDGYMSQELETTETTKTEIGKLMAGEGIKTDEHIRQDRKDRHIRSISVAV